MVAAYMHNSLLVEFMVKTFGTYLKVRTDTSNLLNACCFNGIPDPVCIKVAQAYPELLRSTPGGVLFHSSPCVELAVSNRRIHPFFMRNRNPVHDCECAGARPPGTETYSRQRNWPRASSTESMERSSRSSTCGTFSS